MIGKVRLRFLTLTSSSTVSLTSARNGSMLHLTGSDTAALRALERELEGTRPELAHIIGRVLGSAAGAGARAHLTTTEAAAWMGVSPQTVRNWIDRGWLPAYRPNPLAHRRIARKDFEAVLRFRANLLNHRVAPRSDPEVTAIISHHREDRRRRRAGEPLAQSHARPGEADAVAGRR